MNLVLSAEVVGEVEDVHRIVLNGLHMGEIFLLEDVDQSREAFVEGKRLPDGLEDHRGQAEDNGSLENHEVVSCQTDVMDRLLIPQFKAILLD